MLIFIEWLHLHIYTESNVYVMKLSEYNELARALGYQQETIEKRR